MKIEVPNVYKIEFEREEENILYSADNLIDDIINELKRYQCNCVMDNLNEGYSIEELEKVRSVLIHLTDIDHIC